MDEVIISNQEKLDELKKKISEQGTQNLHILADFDKTLTTSKIPSIISILRDKNYLSEEYSEKAKALFNKYHPIEIDNEISIEEKTSKMKEWWKTHFDLMIKSELKKEHIQKVVESEDFCLRKNIKELFSYLESKNIPLVILSSSGIGDAIPLYLKKENLLYENIFIVSNMFEYDSEGKMIKVKSPMIHILNKNEASLQQTPFFDKIKSRKNIILLGDSLADLKMTQGLEYDNLIKIGFLNKNIEENLEIYKQNFDILLLRDSSLEPVLSLLKEMFS